MPWDDRQDTKATEIVNAAIRALLEHIVDYAGLFPPAGLDLAAAVHNYDAYRRSSDSWMLGRFVVSAARLSDFTSAAAALGIADTDPWPVTVVAANPGEASAVLAQKPATGLRIESVEVRADADAVRDLRRLVDECELYVEAPVDAQLDLRLDAIATIGARAKLRAGGVIAEAFPAPSDVVRFLRGCADRNLGFKATAGLHHPLRGVYRLTYDAGSVEGPMFGFLNLFLAAILIRHGLSDADALSVLTERDASSLTMGESSIGWRGHMVTAAEVADSRARFASSFGSCSFHEPVDELPWSVSGAAA
jgi:hypothetical protein